MIGKSHEVARKTLNLEDVRRSPVALPPQAEQKRVYEAVEQAEAMADAAGDATKSAALRCGKLRQSILKWAFEGRLVEQDPADEPASKLLARIKAERAAEPARSRTQRPRHTTSNGNAR
jgi:type I restriction enzyme S subunit